MTDAYVAPHFQALQRHNLEFDFDLETGREGLARVFNRIANAIRVSLYSDAVRAELEGAIKTIKLYYENRLAQPTSSRRGRRGGRRRRSR